MPTEISNALGTARQFTPQPQSSYQGTYGGVNPTRFQANTSKEVQLAQSIQQLSNALLSYRVRHEEYKDKKGLAEAERMVNGMSPEDIQKLNLIEASQKYGYVDETANPYFKAYVDKLRGGFVASRMKQEYDEYIKNNPPKTIEDSYKSWDSFSKAYIAQFKEDNPVENNTAFDMGYNEQNLVTGIQMTNQFMGKQREKDMEVATASFGNKLGNALLSAPELLKVNGAFTEAIQIAINEGRVANIPESTMMEMLGKTLNTCASEGILDYTRIEQMCDNITISVKADGTPIKLSESINLHNLKQLTIDYENILRPVRDYKEIKAYREKGRTGLDELLVLYDKASTQEEREKYKNMIEYLAPRVESDERTAENRAYYESKQSMEKAQKEASYEAMRENARKIADEWINVDEPKDHVDGVSLSEYRRYIDPTILQAVHQEILTNIEELAKTDPYKATHQLERHSKNPLFEGLMEKYARTRVDYLRAIRPNQDGSPLTNPTATYMVTLCRYNPSAFQRCYGNALFEETMLLDISMSVDNGSIQRYAEFNTLDATARKEKETTADKTFAKMGGYITADVRTLDGDTEDNFVIPDHLATGVKKALALGSYLGQDSIAFLEGYIEKSFYALHGGLIPKALVKEGEGKIFLEAFDRATGGDIESVAYTGGTTLRCVRDDGKTIYIDIEKDIKPKMHEIQTAGKEATNDMMHSIIEISDPNVLNFMNRYN